MSDNTLDPNDPIVRFVALKKQIAEQQSTKSIDDATLQQDLSLSEAITQNDVVTPFVQTQLIRDLMSQVLTRTRVSKKFKRDLSNTHCRVLLSLYKHQRLLGPQDVGVTLAMIKQDITPKCRMYVEAVLQEARSFGIVLENILKGKMYYSINTTHINEVQAFLNDEMRGV